MNMRKMLKENKGFSLVELLVAILIMAVIAGTAITLFGGVLNSSRENADDETAESIKRAILTYMNSTNDVNLSCIGVDPTSVSATTAGVPTGITSDQLISYLGLEVTLAGTTGTSSSVTFVRPAGVPTSVIAPTVKAKEKSDLVGKFGPFLDLTKDFNPKAPGTNGWAITIDPQMQVVTVDSVKDASTAAIVTFKLGTAIS